MPIPRMHWRYTGLRVRDLRRSIRFYERLGFRVGRRGRMDHGGLWVDLHYPGSVHRLELNFYPRRNPFFTRWTVGTEFDRFGFEVSDIDGWVRYLRRARLPIVADWAERGLRYVFARDPDGNWVEVAGRVRRSSPSRRPRGPTRKRRRHNAF
jgi:catechol 2,3-dioxygenase-like lactoylglutathione lyase family enzyme